MIKRFIRKFFQITIATIGVFVAVQLLYNHIWQGKSFIQSIIDVPEASAQFNPKAAQIDLSPNLTWDENLTPGIGNLAQLADFIDNWNPTAGAAGSTKQFQYNNNGAMAGSSQLTQDTTNVKYKGKEIVNRGDLTPTGLVTNGATTLVTGDAVFDFAETTQDYLKTSENNDADVSASELDGVFLSNGFLKRTGSATYTVDSTTYVASGGAAGGDLGGTYPNPSVTDDSHTHTGTTISTLDVSNDTNLAATSPIVLTNDTLSLSQNAGTDVTADLEEEAHASEHEVGGADAIDLLGNVRIDNDVSVTRNLSVNNNLYVEKNSLMDGALSVVGNIQGNILYMNSPLSPSGTVRIVVINPTSGKMGMTSISYGGGINGLIAGGDLTGTFPNPSVVDDSHNHTSSTISNLLAADFSNEDHGDFTYNSGVATIDNDVVALTTKTTGNYVTSVATTSPVTGGASGSEGTVLTLGLTQNAGTDITADLEEEAHASEHEVGGADVIDLLGNVQFNNDVSVTRNLSVNNNLNIEKDLIVDRQITESGKAVVNKSEIDSSSEIAAIVTDESGTGFLLFQTSPTIVSPTINTSINLPSNAIDSATEIATNVIGHRAIQPDSVASSELSESDNYVINDLSVTRNLSVNHNLNVENNLIVDGTGTLGGFGMVTTNTTLDDDKVAFDDADSNFVATTIGAAIEELDDVNGSGPNATDGKVDWSQIISMPTGFADGVDASGGSGGTNFWADNGSYISQDLTHRGDDLSVANVLYAKVSTQRVGIGTVVPGATLDIRGNLSVSSTLSVSSSIKKNGKEVIVNTDSAGGDLGGTYPNPSVQDDSHTHTGTTLSVIDIGDDTNLAATSPVVLTGDTLTLTQNAGTNVTADLEEETHAKEHADGGADALTRTGNLNVNNDLSVARNLSVNNNVYIEKDLVVDRQITEDGQAVINKSEINTSAEIASIVTDESGTGFLILQTNPVIVSPTINTSINLPVNAVDAQNELATNVVGHNQIQANAVGNSELSSSANYVVNDLSVTRNLSVNNNLYVEKDSVFDRKLSLGNNLQVTGGAVFDTNTLLVDANQNKVGINMGTETLSVALEVNGDVSESGALTVTKTIRIGSSKGGKGAYNIIDDDSTNSSNSGSGIMNAPNDVYIEGDIEIDGAITGSGAIQGSSLFLSNILSPSSTVRFAVIDSLTGKIGMSGVNFPKSDGGGVGGGLNNVIEDTTPQLGGDLDVNGKRINDAIGSAVDMDDSLSVSENLTLGKTFRVGATSGKADFNVIDNDTTVSSNAGIGLMNGADDLYVEGALEIDGNVTGAGNIQGNTLFMSNPLSPTGTVRFAVIDSSSGKIGMSSVSFPTADGAGGGTSQWTDEGSSIKESDAGRVRVYDNGDLSMDGNLTVKEVMSTEPYIIQLDLDVSVNGSYLYQGQFPYKKGTIIRGALSSSETLADDLSVDVYLGTKLKTIDKTMRPTSGPTSLIGPDKTLNIDMTDGSFLGVKLQAYDKIQDLTTSGTQLKLEIQIKDVYL